MDKNVTKITKKRLSDFLAYEWILIIVFSVVAVIIVNLVYKVTSVDLTVGQTFKIYYDYDIYSGSAQKVSNQVKNALSFDVQEFTYEYLLEDDDVLYARTANYDGDLIITTDEVPGEGAKRTNVLAKSRVDSYEMYTYTDLYNDARAYLLTMKKDGVTVGDNEDIDYDKHLDEQKIEQGFNERLGKDNRFRKSQKQTGIDLEKGRIRNLCKEVNDFNKILSLSDDYFFTYTRFEQKITTAEKEGNQKDYESYKPAYETELKYRKNARYGLRVDLLAKGYSSVNKKDVTELLRLEGNEPSAKNIVIMVFDFLEQQPELQFETISAINAMVKTFSTILDN